ncbi:MAG: EAL domain-containing protein [Terracidiphilus sp.]|jgi:sensor c-di-GMP phosphodiesterase-like protein
MNTERHRVRVTLAVTILATVCGWGTGFLLGGGLAVRQAIHQLRRDADRLIAEENATLKETFSTMGKMSSSPYPYCSEAEVAYFRKLIFQTDYLADAGRIRDGVIDCSATLEKADLPREPMKPAFVMPGGAKVYRVTGPLQIRDQITLGIQFKDMFVVINSGAGRRLDPNALSFIMTLRPGAGQDPGTLLSTTPEPVNNVFTKDGLTRNGQNLYFTRCTTDQLSCDTTNISIVEALNADRPELKICILMGGIVGALLGFLASLAYRRSRNMRQQLRRAISKDKLRLVYQPIVDLATKRIVGAEALVRWTDEEGFAVPPDVFVREAEEAGFVGSLTRLVVRHTLRDFSAALHNNPEFRLSINIAATDLSDPAFLPMLEEALIVSGVQPQSLAIEITEGSTARYEVAINTIRRLHDMGYRVHIDDFGTGYSSLSYLKDLQIYAIKIDKSFTRSIGTEAVTVAILPQILAMAEALKLQVIVEGIETAPQAEYFSSLNMPVLAQGWFFGYPVPADRFFHLLADDEDKAQAATAAN